MNHILTLAYCPARILERGCKRLYDTAWMRPGSRHWIIDQHYPLNRDENLAQLRKIQALYFAEWIDSGFDRGLHRGLNNALAVINPKPTDTITLYDPDSGPTGFGWDHALVGAIAAGYEVACLGEPRAMRELVEYGYTERRLPAIRVWEPKRNVVMSVSTWSYRSLSSVGGFSQPKAYYGGLEAAMWGKITRWAYLPDYGEENSGRLEHDPEYHAYKWAHCHSGFFGGSFADYLRDGCPRMGEAPRELP